MRTALLLSLMMLFLSTLNLPGNQSFADAGSLEVTIGWVTYAKALFLFAPLWLSFSVFTKQFARNAWLLSSLILLSLLGILTTLWSPLPSYTLMRAGAQFLLCIDVVLLISSYQRLYGSEALKGVIRHLLIVVGIITTGFLILGLTGSEYAWRKVYIEDQLMFRLGGDILGPNTLGALAGINLILVWFGFARKNSWTCRVLLALSAASSVYDIVYSGSRGVLVSLFGAVLLYLVLRLITTRSWFLVGFMLLVSALIITIVPLVTSNYMLEMIPTFLSREGNINEIYTLTGRTDLWKALFNHNDIQRIIIGNGFGVPTGEGSIMFYSWKTFNTHNGYLQVLLGLGLVGLLLFVDFIFSVFKGILWTIFSSDTLGKEYAWSSLSVITFILIDNIVESVLGIQILPQTVIMILLGLGVMSCFQRSSTIQL